MRYELAALFGGLGLIFATGCGGEDAVTDSDPAVGQTEEPIWSSGWSNTGFSPTGKTGAAPWAGHHLTLFWRASNGHILHSWQPEGSPWQAVEDIASNAASDPSASSIGNDRIDIVWRGTNNHLMHRVYSGGFWPTEDTGTIISGSPSVAVWGTSFYSVFWRNSSNNRLNHRWYDLTTSTWSAVEDFGFQLASDPVVMYRGMDPWGGGELFDIFYRGTNGHLKHHTMPHNGQWVPSPSEDLGGGPFRANSTPTAAPRWPGQSLDAFYTGSDNKLRRRSFQVGLGWGAWETVDASTSLGSSPSAMSWGEGRVDVFATSSSQLRQRTWTRTLDVAQIGQEQSNWCWATTGQMISRYWGNEFVQCYQATHAVGGTNCCINPSTCNFGGLADYAWMGFAFDTSQAAGGPITLQQAREQVAWGRPWDHGIIWVGGGAHGVVGIDAFWFDNDWWLVINDPSPQGPGSTYVQRYSEYLGVPGVSIGDWDIYNIRPL